MYEITDLNKSIGFFLGHATRAIKNTLSRSFSDSNSLVTVEQWVLLMGLWSQDGLCQNDLTEAVTREKTTVTRLIDGLEKKNLIVRIQDKDDRRKNRIYLTKTGKEISFQLMPVASKSLEKAIEGFSENEIEQLKNFLKRIIDNLK